MVRNTLGIPDYVCAQQIDNNVGLVYALRLKTDANQMVSLEYQSQVVELIHYTKDFESQVTDLLLDHGTPFEEVKNPHNVQRARNDIARDSRRGAGNYVIIHKSQATTFDQVFPDHKLNGIRLVTASNPRMLGKMITTYKNPSGEIDGGLIIGYRTDMPGFFGYTATHVAQYTRVMTFNHQLITGSLREQRRLRKAQFIQ